MIFNDDVLFIHVPKTAGMSVTDFLRNKLEGKITVTAPEGHEISSERVEVITGLRHEWLYQAEKILKRLNRSLNSFQRIISIIRNPYDLEVSRFFYLRIGRPHDMGVALDLAMKGNFDEFCEKAPFMGRIPSQIEEWYLYGDRLLPNMRIVRFEELERGLLNALHGYVDGLSELPRVNVSMHEHYEKYLTPRAEAAIYRKYSWVFDAGYYTRHPMAEL